VLLAAALADPVWAQTAESGAADPALAPIAAFDQSLLEAMKAGGGAAGVETRYRRLLPVVEKTFDLPTMMRFAVGPSWSGYSAAQQEGLVRAFGRLSAANLSHNFDSFSGQEFKLNPVVETRGPDKLVRTQIVSKTGAGADLNYRMRRSGAGWKVIDVYFGAISQLTAQRSDFTATVASGGPEALMKKIDAQTAKLLTP
jgi:phospholipid transport system substrate-binding protein